MFGPSINYTSRKSTDNILRPMSDYPILHKTIDLSRHYECIIFHAAELSDPIQCEDGGDVREYHYILSDYEHIRKFSCGLYKFADGLSPRYTEWRHPCPYATPLTRQQIRTEIPSYERIQLENYLTAKKAHYRQSIRAMTRLMRLIK